MLRRFGAKSHKHVDKSTTTNLVEVRGGRQPNGRRHRMNTSFEDQAKNTRGRAARNEVPSSKEILEQAHALASEIEELLMTLSRGIADADTFRVRLARAHTLSLLDQLAELIGSSPSGHGPA